MPEREANRPERGSETNFERYIRRFVRAWDPGAARWGITASVDAASD
jgi:hypothetical protein